MRFGPGYSTLEIAEKIYSWHPARLETRFRAVLIMRIGHGCLSQMFGLVPVDGSSVVTL